MNYSYYPILINEAEFGLNRDELLEKLQANNILARRYFYPLVTQFELYKDYVSSTPNAKSISEQVLCIPIHNALAEEEQMKVIEVICG